MANETSAARRLVHHLIDRMMRDPEFAWMCGWKTRTQELLIDARTRVGSRSSRCCATSRRASRGPTVASDIYGYDVVYRTGDGRELTCHYVGGEASVRRRALLRTHAREVVSLRPMTRAEYERAFGRGRM